MNYKPVKASKTKKSSQNFMQKKASVSIINKGKSTGIDWKGSQMNTVFGDSGA